MSSRSSNSIDRRISIPNMSTLSASSAAMIAAVGPTLDKFKQWSRSRYKCTRQSIFEKLGKTTRTVDIELDAKIEVRTLSEKTRRDFRLFDVQQLRETKRRYESILALARSYANHFANLMFTQKALSELETRVWSVVKVFLFVQVIIVSNYNTNHRFCPTNLVTMRKPNASWCAMERS